MILPKNWIDIFGDEIKKPYFKKLQCFLDLEYESKIIFPKKENIFKAFELINFEDIRVVILGQDPYINDGQANGMAFSIENTSRNFNKNNMPPSLKNIFKEAKINYNNGDLTNWAKNGVFLLNSILTVEKGKTLSHKNKGWETFTDFIVKKLGDREHPIVFMLWGNFAIKKAELIKNFSHLVLKSSHPSPLSCKGFFGNNHFLIAKEFLNFNPFVDIIT